MYLNVICAFLSYTCVCVYALQISSCNWPEFRNCRSQFPHSWVGNCNETGQIWRGISQNDSSHVKSPENSETSWNNFHSLLCLVPLEHPTDNISQWKYKQRKVNSQVWGDGSKSGKSSYKTDRGRGVRKRTWRRLFHIDNHHLPFFTGSTYMNSIW